MDNFKAPNPNQYITYGEFISDVTFVKDTRQVLNIV